MTMIEAKVIEVGVKGQRITVRGSCPPTSERSYGNEQEIELDLTLARELHRLLGKLIPLAEKSGTPAAILAVAKGSAA